MKDEGKDCPKWGKNCGLSGQRTASDLTHDPLDTFLSVNERDMTTSTASRPLPDRWLVGVQIPCVRQLLYTLC